MGNYLIYGSFAYSYYTGKNIDLNDIDIIASKKSFDNIKKALDKNPNWKVYEWEKGLHINSAKHLGIDGKPFDISIDSYEDFFQHKGISLKDYQFLDKESNIKLITLDNLSLLYLRISQTDSEKKEKYKNKSDVLQNIKNK